MPGFILIEFATTIKGKAVSKYVAGKIFYA